MSGYKRAAKPLSTAFFSQMAALKNRRQLKLFIALPPATTTACSPLPLLTPRPLPPSLPATTNNTAILDLEKLCLLGHGNGGSVFQVRHKHSSAVYALKVIPNECDDNARRQIIREIEVLRCTTDSPFVVRCYGNFEKPCGEISLLLEYMDAGSLDSLLKAKGPFSETSLTHIARQVLSGLNYLHMLKVIHRDIKPSNLLVNQKMEVKIADFGVSKIMSKGVDLCKSYVGTCAYMSPERFDPETYGLRYNGYAADIWSIGLSMLELYMGFLPVLARGQKPDWATLMCAVCFEEPPSAPETASKDFRSFIHCCLQKDANKRWTAAQLLPHPFVAKNGRN